MNIAGQSNGNVAIGALKVFGGSGVPLLTDRICESIGIKRGHAKVERFPDGEASIKLDDDVRGKDCFVVQSTCPPVNDNLMELLIFIDCLRRASANRITAVIPYFGYARQDRKAEGRTPITAKLVANLIVKAGAHRVLAMDLHADQIQGFFDIPVDHLSAVPVIARHFQQLDLKDVVLLSPDVGNIKTASAYADRLGGDLAVIHKKRTGGDTATAVSIIGTVRDKTVLIFDDMITTAGTVCSAARLVREHGARAVYIGATHAVFAGPAYDRISQAEFNGICVTDTIALPEEARRRVGALTVVSVAELMGEAIRRIHNHESVSALFRQ